MNSILTQGPPPGQAPGDHSVEDSWAGWRGAGSQGSPGNRKNGSCSFQAIEEETQAGVVGGEAGTPVEAYLCQALGSALSVPHLVLAASGSDAQEGVTCPCHSYERWRGACAPCPLDSEAFQHWHPESVQTQEQAFSPRGAKQGLSQPGPWWTIPSLVLGGRLLVIWPKMALALGFPLPSCGVSSFLLTSRSKQDRFPHSKPTLHLIP